MVVHLLSALMYPLYPWLRDRLAGRRSNHTGFAIGWLGVSAATIAVLSGLAAAGARGYELPSFSRDPGFDRLWMRRMAAHHAQGVELARMAALQGQAPHLRALANLMAASQGAELTILRQWWRSWENAALPPAAGEDCGPMPGMISPERIAGLRAMAGPGFDQQFAATMSEHHRGAIAMADEALLHAGEPRLRILAHTIRHAQTGEIAMMDGIGPGFSAVAIATRALLRPQRQPAVEIPK